MKPHKHAELIKAWADGAEIEIHHHSRGWEKPSLLTWAEEYEYRIKPEEPKPDVVVHEHVRFWRGNVLAEPDRKSNIRYVFDGETGELKSAEVLK